MNSALPRISQPVSSLSAAQAQEGSSADSAGEAGAQCPSGLPQAATSTGIGACARSAGVAAGAAPRARAATSPDDEQARARRCAALRARLRESASVPLTTRCIGQRRPLDDRGGMVGARARRAQARDDARQLRDAHVEDDRVIALARADPSRARHHRAHGRWRRSRSARGRRCVSGMPALAAAPSAAVMPGTTTYGMPCAARASISSPPRPNMNGSPPFRRATRQSGARMLDQELVNARLRVRAGRPLPCRRKCAAASRRARASTASETSRS